MTNDDFWRLIETIDRNVLRRGEGHEDEALQPLIDALASLDEAELRSFQNHLAQSLYDLDGRKYADAAGDIGDDGFLYARCFVVAMGRDVYRRTLRDPDLMPKGVDHWCEPLLYVAEQAWEIQGGESLDFQTKVSFETGSNTALWS